MKTYPFEATAFTSDPSSHLMPTPDGGEAHTRFVLDLERLVIPKNPCVVDYNHDAGEVIGSATLSVADGVLLARGVFCSAKDGDRAQEVGEIAGTVPLGISPTLSLDGAEAEIIAEGASGQANGRVYEGPLTIFRDVTILGISVCPYPTDSGTSVSPLVRTKLVGLNNVLNNIGVVKMNDVKMNGVKLNNEIEKPAEPVPIDEDTVEQLSDDQKIGDETGVQDGSQGVRDPELQEFIDEFGIEKGVGFFQKGLSIDDARMEDYRELKRLAGQGGAEGNDDPKEETLEDDAASSDDDKKEDETTSRLSRCVGEFGKKLTILEGMITRLSKATRPIGATSSPTSRPSSDKKGYADAVFDALGVNGRGVR